MSGKRKLFNNLWKRKSKESSALSASDTSTLGSSSTTLTSQTHTSSSNGNVAPLPSTTPGRVDISPIDTQWESNSLWDTAYDQLKTKSKGLVDKYERIISFEMADRHDIGNNIDQTDHNHRRSQMNELVETRKDKAESRGSVIENLSSAAEFLLGFKDTIAAILQAYPPAGLAFAGVSILLERVFASVKASKANIEGLEYITTRLDWYLDLSDLLLRSHFPDATAGDDICRSIRLLLEKGADANLPDKSHTPLFRLISSWGRMEYLRPFKDNPRTPSVIQSLLDYGADPNSMIGNTNAILAVSRNLRFMNIIPLKTERATVEMAQALFKSNKTNLDIQDPLGMTPMHLICDIGGSLPTSVRVSLLSVILERGANPNILSNDGDYPLFLICGRLTNGKYYVGVDEDDDEYEDHTDEGDGDAENDHKDSGGGGGAEGIEAKESKEVGVRGGELGEIFFQRQMLRLLFKHGAKSNLKLKGGRSARDIAFERGREDWLKDCGATDLDDPDEIVEIDFADSSEAESESDAREEDKSGDEESNEEGGAEDNKEDN